MPQHQETQPVDAAELGLTGSAAFARSRWSRRLTSTVPLVLAGAMTVGMTVTGVVPASAEPLPRKTPKPGGELRAAPAPEPVATPVVASTLATPGSVTPLSAPATHRVETGETVSSIAARYGLSTAAVLAANGLGWKSLIFPGQTLTLSGTPKPAAAPAPAPAPAASDAVVRSGDTVSAIAAAHGTTVDAVLAANGLTPTSIIYPGQTLRIPGGMAPVAAVTPIASAPPAATTAEHVVQAGETLSSIARQHGASVSSLRAENGLDSDVIFAGRTLRIPLAPVQDGTTVTPLTDEMAANAAVVVAVGREVGVGDEAIVIALAAAMQESSLRNIDFGDRDSLGLFQQRPSQGWGNPRELLDARHATRLFFGGASGPAVEPDGLLDIPGWQGMSVTQAAQAVQVSAFPDAYAKWEKSARAWLVQLS